MTEQGLRADQIDTSRAHPARMYDYYLGGKDNYEVDRIAAEKVRAAMPNVMDAARVNRAFMQRAVRAVVGGGIRQIIDIGTGIPTSPNTHEIAQAIDPQTSVAYVDNDPIVGVHANARLRGVGATGFVLADIRDPRAVLEHPTVRSLIDFERPIGLNLLAVMHFVRDEEDPWGIVAALRDALPAGSVMILSHVTADVRVGLADQDDRLKEAVHVYEGATSSITLRPIPQIRAFFDGFEVEEPGVVTCAEWRPDPDTWNEAPIGFYGGVGRKV
jgi:hypothetical protein